MPTEEAEHAAPKRFAASGTRVAIQMLEEAQTLMVPMNRQPRRNQRSDSLRSIVFDSELKDVFNTEELDLEIDEELTAALIPID
jgi:hypothetical protein